MDLNADNAEAAEAARQHVVLVVAAVLQYVVLGVGTYAAPHYCKEPMHDSSLSGHAWLDKLLLGHPDVFHVCFGMHKHVFLALVVQMHLLGYEEKPNSTIFLDESLAIFLYTCVTGVSIDHVAVRFKLNSVWE